MRWGKALLVLLLCGAFALLLSALVVSPEDAAVLPQPVEWAELRLLPLSLPVQGMDALAAAQQTVPRVLCLLLFTLIPALPLLFARRDANGRVLQAKRYENSFYQVFRQEVAGG